MSIESVLRFEYEFSTPIDVEPVEERVTSGAGLLPIRQFDEQLGWSAGFAAQLRDKRCGGFHTFVEMVRQRVFGIIAGYEDQNDHDTLRSDGLFKLVAGRLPDDDDLASQPTLSRMENSVTAGERLQDWFLEQFIQSFDEPPGSLTLDMDTFDDPTHGQQQLTLFHGFYRQYQYLARVITCAENDLVVFPVLLYGTARPTLGALDDIRRVVARLRQVWPDVQIHLRTDSGFAGPDEYADRGESENRNKELMQHVTERRFESTAFTAGNHDPIVMSENGQPVCRPRLQSGHDPRRRRLLSSSDRARRPL